MEQMKDIQVPGLITRLRSIQEFNNKRKYKMARINIGINGFHNFG